MGESCRSDILKAVHNWLANIDTDTNTAFSWAKFVADFVWLFIGCSLLFSTICLRRCKLGDRLFATALAFFIEIFSGFLLDQVFNEWFYYFSRSCLLSEVLSLFITPAVMVVAELLVCICLNRLNSNPGQQQQRYQRNNNGGKVEENLPLTQWKRLKWRWDSTVVSVTNVVFVVCETVLCWPK